MNRTDGNSTDALTQQAASEQPDPQQPPLWGRGPGGEVWRLYGLSSPEVRVQISNLGGRLIRVRTPDRRGTWGDLVLGHEQPEPYWRHPQAIYYSAVIGRVGNRIAGGRFELGAQAYQLATNDGPNALHGGPGGLHGVSWQAGYSEGGLALSYTSPAGEEGYPGKLEVQARYSLSGPVLRLDLSAQTDAETLVNLTHHPFWNLCGLGEAAQIADGTQAPSVLGHQLTLGASRYTPVNAALIPTGELADVAGTPFDFRTPRSIGERIGDADQQLSFAGGYDHNFVLDGSPRPDRAGGDLNGSNLNGGDLNLAATLFEPVSGRQLKVLTDQPGLQVYSGNFSDGTFAGWNAQRYGPRSSVCLEPQRFPDAPHQPNFPSTVLRPGEVYTWTTEYHFSLME